MSIYHKYFTDKVPRFKRDRFATYGRTAHQLQALPKANIDAIPFFQYTLVNIITLLSNPKSEINPDDSSPLPCLFSTNFAKTNTRF